MWWSWITTRLVGEEGGSVVVPKNPVVGVYGTVFRWPCFAPMHVHRLKHCTLNRSLDSGSLARQRLKHPVGLESVVGFVLPSGSQRGVCGVNHCRWTHGPSLVSRGEAGTGASRDSAADTSRTAWLPSPRPRCVCRSERPVASWITTRLPSWKDRGNGPTEGTITPQSTSAVMAWFPNPQRMQRSWTITRDAHDTTLREVCNVRVRVRLVFLGPVTGYAD